MPKLQQERHESFAQYYSVHGNGTKAALEAGYSKKSAHAQATRLLKDAKIRLRISELKTQTFQKLEVNREVVLREITRVGLSDIRNYFNSDGTIKPLDQLTDDQAAAIASIEFTLPKSTGKKTSKQTLTIASFKLSDKLKALEMLAKHFHLFEELTPPGDTHNHFDLTKLDKTSLNALLKAIKK
ncbi:MULTISPECIES: terminase small subunit [unclassified Paraflavitalea]|uniref:terminase small subunit n=1 Tax=unclassified Paraflavitalea TaxID=2798305 RepID=UPI003D349CDC